MAEDAGIPVGDVAGDVAAYATDAIAPGEGYEIPLPGDVLNTDPDFGGTWPLGEIDQPYPDVAGTLAEVQHEIQTLENQVEQLEGQLTPALPLEGPMVQPDDFDLF